MDTFKKSDSKYAKYNGQLSKSVGKNYFAVKNQLKKDSGKKTLSKSEKDDALLGASLLTTNEINKDNAIQAIKKVKEYKQDEDKKTSILGVLNPLKIVPYTFRKLILSPVLSLVKFMIKAPLKLLSRVLKKGLLGITRVATTLALKIPKIFFNQIKKFNLAVFKFIKNKVLNRIFKSAISVGNSIKKGINIIGSIFNKGIKTALNVLNNGVQNIFIKPLKFIGNFAINIFNKSIDFLRICLRKSIETLFKVLDFLKAGFKVAYESTKKILTSSVNKITGWFKNKIDKTKKLTQRLYTRVWGGFKNWGKSKLDKVKSLIDKGKKLGTLKKSKLTKITSESKLGKIAKTTFEKGKNATKWTFDKLLKTLKLPKAMMKASSKLIKLLNKLKKVPVIGPIIVALDFKDVYSAFSSGDKLKGFGLLSDMFFDLGTVFLKSTTNPYVKIASALCLSLSVLTAGCIMGYTYSKCKSFETPEAENMLKNISIWSFFLKKVVLKTMKEQEKFEKELSQIDENNWVDKSILVLKMNFKPIITAFKETFNVSFNLAYEVCKDTFDKFEKDYDSKNAKLIEERRKAIKEKRAFKAITLGLRKDLSILGSIVWSGTKATINGFKEIGEAAHDVVKEGTIWALEETFGERNKAKEVNNLKVENNESGANENEVLTQSSIKNLEDRKVLETNTLNNTKPKETKSSIVEIQTEQDSAKKKKNYIFGTSPVLDCMNIGFQV